MYKIYRFITIVVAILVLLTRPLTASAMFSLTRPLLWTEKKALSEVTYSLGNRNKDPYVNEVFSDNILLTVAYMSGSVKGANEISWEKIKAPSVSKLTLKPGQTFAFHDATLEKYNGKIVSTTNAHFNLTEGFKFSGYLVGDGVCHLASFLKVAAKKAGLIVEAPVSHDFAPIPQVAKKDGVSIYYSPFNKSTSTLQNLYITNSYSKPIAFVFTHKDHNLNIKVQELN